MLIHIHDFDTYSFKVGIKVGEVNRPIEDILRAQFIIFDDSGKWFRIDRVIYNALTGEYIVAVPYTETLNNKPQ